MPFDHSLVGRGIEKEAGHVRAGIVAYRVSRQFGKGDGSRVELSNK